MSFIQKVSTIKNYNRAMKFVRRIEGHVLQDRGASALRDACDKVHITTGEETNPFLKMIHEFRKFKKSFSSYKYPRKAEIQKNPEYVYYDYLYLEPYKEVKIWVNRDTNKVKYFDESNGVKHKLVHFDEDGDVLHIRYDKAHPRRTLKSIFYGSGKREVSQN